MNIKRTLAALLALLMTTAALASCSDSGDSAKETTQAQAGETTAPAETTTAKLTPDLPALDFKGAEFLILTSGEADTNGYHWQTYDVYAEEENGDAINDAIYARNMYINETYGVEIKEKQSEATTLEEAQRVILAGEDVYKAIMTNLASHATLAQSGQTLDLYTVPHIDLEQPWWDNNLVANLSVNGKMNYAAGDITVIDNDSIWVLMFNKQAYANFGFDNLYELVDSGAWVMDKFIEISMSSAADLNGDGVMKWEDDRFGLITNPWTAIATLYSSDMHLTTKNDKDLPVFDFDIDRGMVVAETVGALMNAPENLVQGQGAGSGITNDNTRETFEAGRGLFFGEVLQTLKRMRASETAFGLTPWPMLNEEQETYKSVCIANACKAIAIPVTVANVEMSGAILEALAAESMYTLTPAYYETALKEKYMRDSESVKMLDVILENLSVDLGFTNDWASLATNIRTSVAKNDGQLVSIIDSNKTAFETAMQKTIDAYLAN